MKIPEEHDLESQIRKEREWRFLRNTRVRKQAQQVIQKGKSSQRGRARTALHGEQRPQRAPVSSPPARHVCSLCIPPHGHPRAPLAVRSFSGVVQTGAGDGEGLAWGQGHLRAEGLLGLHLPWVGPLQGRPSARLWLLAALSGRSTSAPRCFQREAQVLPRPWESVSPG